MRFRGSVRRCGTERVWPQIPTLHCVTLGHRSRGQSQDHYPGMDSTPEDQDPGQAAAYVDSRLTVQKGQGAVEILAEEVIGNESTMKPDMYP
jgi:hypothetical protein